MPAIFVQHTSYPAIHLISSCRDGLRHRDGEARRHRLSHGRSKFSEALTRVALLVVLVIFAKRAIRIRIG